MLAYKDINTDKKAFIFELDNVLYPEKDYLLQVYYLFASFIEYIETVPNATELTAFMKKVYEVHGADRMFDKAKEAFDLDEKYRENFERLHLTARLPLKLLLFKSALALLQDIVVDRKQIFIVTDGNPEQQLSNMALLMPVRRMGYIATIHGFRSAFRDWAAEKTNFPPIGAS